MKKFALAGNPNSGKTTLFNALTGSTAHTGNWPGVTVDKREGIYKKGNEDVAIVDLPGIYSLSPYTPEEVVSRNFIIEEKPDCIINIVDATNLERNLYLTTQLLEMDVPMVVALNMMDAVEKNGDKINIDELSKRLGVPVVSISALKNDGINKLMETAIQASGTKRKGFTVLEKSDLQHLINDIRIAFGGMNVTSPLFHAVKLVENDEIEMTEHPGLVKMVDEFKSTFSDETFGDDFEALVSDARYKYISEHFTSVVDKKSTKTGEKLSNSDKIDKVLTHRWWGIPIFIAIMFVIFHFTFAEDFLFMGTIANWFGSEAGLNIQNVGVINFFTGMGAEIDEITGEVAALEGIPSLGVFLQSWFGFITGSLMDGASALFDLAGASDTWYCSLVVDGLLNGLDAVCSFIPQIMMLFLFMAILEDSGYMSRVAFILDRAFRKFGLSGKAFIPMLTGFGCSVPAIMATRTLEDQKEKNRTIRLITCFSCGAKAPIWTLLAAVVAALGLHYADIFVFSIYIGGIFLAVILAIFMKLFDKNQYVSPFIMELPTYHMPQAKNVGAHLWEKLKHYIIKAGTIIAASLVVIWFLQTFGVEDGAFCMVEDIENSLIGYVGKGLAYIFYPTGWAMGADGWKYVVSSLTGLVAKEDVVGTMALLFSSGNEEALAESIAAAGSISGAGIYSFAIFNLLTFPCMAAISTAYAEQTKKEFAKTMLFWIGISYILSALAFWVGRLCEVSLWAGILLIAMLVICVAAIATVIVLRDKRAKLAE